MARAQHADGIEAARTEVRPASRAQQPPRHKRLATGGSAFSDGTVTTSVLDGISVREIINDAIEVQITGVLQDMRVDQHHLTAKLDAVWALLVQIDEGLAPPPVQQIKSWDSEHKRAGLLKSQVASSGKSQMWPPQTTSYQCEIEEWISDASSNYTGAELKTGTIHSLDMNILDALHTDQLFETNGLAKYTPDISIHKPSGRPEKPCGRPAVPSRRVSPTNTATKLKKIPVERARSKERTNTAPPCLEPTFSEINPRGGDEHGAENLDSGDEQSVETESRCSSKRPMCGMPSSRDVRNSKSMSGMEDLREEKDTELVNRTACFAARTEEVGDIWTPGVSGLFSRMPELTLRVFGVVPFGEGRIARWYNNMLLLIPGALFLYSVALAIGETDLLYKHVSNALYALGGLLGHLSLRERRVQNLLGPRKRPLELYARNMGFLSDWRATSRLQFAVVVLIWLCIVAVKVLSIVYPGCSSSLADMDLPYLFSFIFISGLLAALTYCQLHVCCGLEMAVDKFCVRFFDGMDVPRGITEWNVLQALLRRAAHTVDSCFLALNTLVLAMTLLTGVEVLRGQTTSCTKLRYGWVLPHMVMMLYAVFRAAAVSEKCSRVPSLVNSWMVEERQLDDGRQYIVQYITNSYAGFFVKGVRLNGFMALKLTYFFGIIIFTLLSHSVLDT